MKSANLIKTIWMVALICGAIGILGHFGLVVIKYVSNFNFELLLIAFILLLLLRLFKK